MTNPSASSWGPLFLELWVTNCLSSGSCLLICWRHYTLDFLLIYCILKHWGADFILHPLNYSGGSKRRELGIVEKVCLGWRATCLFFALNTRFIPVTFWGPGSFAVMGMIYLSFPQLVPLADKASNSAFISYCLGPSLSLFQIPLRKKKKLIRSVQP